MKFKNKELIIFDLDGTLIDSVPDLALAVNHTLSLLERQTFSEDEIRLWVGNGAQTLVKRLLSGSAEVDKNIDEELFQKALGIFLDFYDKNVCVKTTLYPNVGASLKLLKERGYHLTIVTNKPFSFVEPILVSLGLENIFELCLGGDSLKLKKPDPSPLLYMCNKLNISIEKSIMIGDSKNDILAANSANIQSIAVNYGYNYGEDISIYSPDYIVDDFSYLLDCFE